MAYRLTASCLLTAAVAALGCGSQALGLKICRNPVANLSGHLPHLVQMFLPSAIHSCQNLLVEHLLEAAEHMLTFLLEVAAEKKVSE